MGRAMPTSRVVPGPGPLTAAPCCAEPHGSFSTSKSDLYLLWVWPDHCNSGKLQHKAQVLHSFYKEDKIKSLFKKGLKFSNNISNQDIWWHDFFLEPKCPFSFLPFGIWHLARMKMGNPVLEAYHLEQQKPEKNKDSIHRESRWPDDRFRSWCVNERVVFK